MIKQTSAICSQIYDEKSLPQLNSKINFGDPRLKMTQ